MGKPKPEPKGNWIVRLRCTVDKVIECVDCTEEQAAENPWDHAAGGEDEVQMMDWEVTKVEPNE